MTFVAAPLTKGSAASEVVNPPGRRREDDENLVAFHMLQDPISDVNVTPAWGKGTKNGSASIAVAMNLRGREHRANPELDDVASLRGSQGGSSRSYVADTMVRRLTPTECERLQALPDGWTDFGPDSRRYAALGDAVTASVSEWIGRRLRGL